MSRLRPLLLAVVLILATSACQVRAEVAVVVDEDGSGTVTVTVRLDAEATNRLGDPATALRLDDLRTAGWSVEDPATSDDGALTLRATRGFGSPAQLAEVLAEVGGPEGVFCDVSLEIVDGFASTSYDFSARVELTGNPEQFSDDALAGALGGQPLARSLEELTAEGAADPDAMVLDVSVALPGGDPSTDATVSDGAATWSFPASGGAPTSEQIVTSSTVTSSSTRTLVLAGGLSLLVALGLVVAGLVRRSR